jgi:CubicO group peptidase (beta-lactamase class C family)
MKLKFTTLIFINLIFTLTAMAQNIFYTGQTKLPRNQAIESLKTYVENEMSKSKVVGLSIAVVDEQGIFLSDGFGYADKENNIAATSSTLFPIASITKTFTGISVMQLVEKGLIDLDTPIVTYIPELKMPEGAEKQITTRMLLTHHSGIHGDILYNWYLPEVSDNPLVYEQVIDLINEVGTIFPPAKLYSYSNAAYSLLGVLIHKISGLSYPDYVRKNIFEPLGMENSIAFVGESTSNVISKGYDGNNETTMPMKLGIPAGGIALTSDDAAKYLLIVIGDYQGENSLLKQETVTEMMTAQNTDNEYDKGFSIGYTWFLQDPINEFTTYAAHRGELPPYHAMFITLPELKIGIFISVNTNDAADFPYDIAHKIIYDLYEYKTDKTIPNIEKPEVITLSKNQLKQYEGIYPNVYFGAMQVKVSGKKLILNSPEMPTNLVLVPRADSTFSLKARMLGINFKIKKLDALKVEFREIAGEEYLYFVIQNNIVNPNLKIEKFDIPNEYKNYAGKYNVVNMENSDSVVKDVKIKFNQKSGFATFKYTFLGRHKFNMIIGPIDEKNAKFAGVGYFLGDKIRWEKSENKIFMYWSGLKLEKIK